MSRIQQKAMVLAAIQEGAATSQDVVDVTGLSRQKVTAYLARLYGTGAIKRKPLERTAPGRREYFYEEAR